MAIHLTGIPDSGVRQVNVRYLATDPEFADIERFRSMIAFKSLNKIMRDALLLGCRQLLEEYESSGVEGRIAATAISTPVIKKIDTQASSSKAKASIPDKAAASGDHRIATPLQLPDLKPATPEEQADKLPSGFSASVAKNHLDAW